MKRKFVYPFILILILGFLSSLLAGEMSNKWDIRLDGGGLAPISGNITNSLSSTDALNTGASFGVSARYWFDQGIGVEAGYSLGWLNLDESKFSGDFQKTAAGQKPSFDLQTITLRGLYNFQGLMSTGSRWHPILGAGVGLYPFRFSDDQFSGNTFVNSANGQELQKTSFGLNGTAGLDFRATENISIFGQADYNYLFAKDSAKFGDQFNNQSFLSFGLGLAYHISRL